MGRSARRMHSRRRDQHRWKCPMRPQTTSADRSPPSHATPLPLRRGHPRRQRQIHLLEAGMPCAERFPARRSVAILLSSGSSRAREHPGSQIHPKRVGFILDNLLSKGHIACEMSGHQECVHGKLCGTQMLPFAERKNADVGIHPRTMHRRIVTCPTFP